MATGLSQKDAFLPPVESDGPRRDCSLLNNRELSDAIMQTFELMNHCAPCGPEIERARKHWCILLSERESRLLITKLR